MALRWMVGCFLGFLLWLWFHANLPRLNSTWPGPVGETYTISPAGSGLLSFSGQGRHHLYNRQYRSHALHRAGTLERKCGLAASQVVPQILPAPSTPKTLKEFQTHTTPRRGGRCFSMQFDGEKPDKITRGACACNDDKVIFENPLNWTTRSFIFREAEGVRNRPPTPEPSGETIVRGRDEENAKRRSFMPGPKLPVRRTYQALLQNQQHDILRGPKS